MKNTLFLFIAMLTAGTVIAQENLHKVKSHKSVAATVASLKQVLQEKNMTIFATIDHRQGALKAGMELRPTTLVIFGNPKVGTKLMQCDQRMGLALPLKMLIWQDAEGITWIGYWAPEVLKNNYHLQDCQDTLVKIKNALDAFARAAAN